MDNATQQVNEYTKLGVTVEIKDNGNDRYTVVIHDKSGDRYIPCDHVTMMSYRHVYRSVIKEG